MAFYKYSAPSNTFKALGSAGVAGEISFDNRESGLESTDVQGAIDETNEIVHGNVVELTSTAQHAHTVGEYFIFIGQFVVTTAAIAVGDTIAVGTNVTATNVATVLSELNSKESDSQRRVNMFNSSEVENAVYTGSVEMYGDPSSIVDFHWNRELVDYTSRIVEIQEGVLLAENLFRLTDITDANDAPGGFSKIPANGTSGTVNSPFGFWSTLLTTNKSEDKYRQQIAFPWAVGELRLAYRVKDNNSWEAWHYINFDS